MKAVAGSATLIEAREQQVLIGCLAEGPGAPVDLADPPPDPRIVAVAP